MQPSVGAATISRAVFSYMPRATECGPGLPDIPLPSLPATALYVVLRGTGHQTLNEVSQVEINSRRVPVSALVIKYSIPGGGVDGSGRKHHTVITSHRCSKVAPPTLSYLKDSCDNGAVEHKLSLFTWCVFFPPHPFIHGSLLETKLQAFFPSASASFLPHEIQLKRTSGWELIVSLQAVHGHLVCMGDDPTAITTMCHRHDHLPCSEWG